MNKVKILFWWPLFFVSCLGEKTMIPAGTPARLEKEYKINFSTNRKIEEITEILQKKIFEKIVSGSHFQASKKLMEPYFLTGKLDPFLFLDFYFDSKDNALFENNAVYRLRYRWKMEEDYEKYIKSFSDNYYPIRVEVQTKTNIDVANENFLVSAMESRFEFRDESSPFSKENPAPKAPWPLKDFINIAKSGTYLNYRLLPYIEMEKNKKSKHIVSPQYIIKTARRRLHLNIVNSWGGGPNPNQAFIITIDHFKFKSFENIASSFKDNFYGNFFEVEIEFERNTSTKLFVDNSDHARKIKMAFEKDHQLLSQIVIQSLNENDVTIHKNTMNKLSRIKRYEMEKK